MGHARGGCFQVAVSVLLLSGDNRNVLGSTCLEQVVGGVDSCTSNGYPELALDVTGQLVDRVKLSG
jgi:hypothetical protein